MSIGKRSSIESSGPYIHPDKVYQVAVIILKDDGVDIIQQKAYFGKWPILAKGRGEEDEI